MAPSRDTAAACQDPRRVAAHATNAAVATAAANEAPPVAAQSQTAADAHKLHCLHQARTLCCCSISPHDDGSRPTPAMALDRSRDAASGKPRRHTGAGGPPSHRCRQANGTARLMLRARSTGPVATCSQQPATRTLAIQAASAAQRTASEAACIFFRRHFFWIFAAPTQPHIRGAPTCACRNPNSHPGRGGRSHKVWEFHQVVETSTNSAAPSTGARRVWRRFRAGTDRSRRACHIRQPWLLSRASQPLCCGRCW